MTTLGRYLRKRREALQASDPEFSLRKVAESASVSPAFLSRLERDEASAGEETTRRLAEILDEDPDVLMALSGKVSTELMSIIQSRPVLFSELIRELKHAPDDAILRVVREVRDGDW